MSAVDRKMRWGEDDDEDDYETPVDANGTKQRIRLTVNTKGQKVRTTTKIRVREVKTRTPIRVITRRGLPKFGDAVEGETNVTIPSRDFVFIEHPDDANAEDADDPALGNTLANFIAKQQERNLERNFGENLESLLANAEDAKEGEGDGDKAGGKYVPPSQRGAGRGVAGASFMDAGGKGGERDNDNTIRVSNLTKAVTEDDLRDLFERFGRIFRISLPRVEKKDEQGNIFKESRGFAYVAYYDRNHAEKAIEALNGYGYDHLILKLEWAKPPAKDTSGAAPQHRSGYGQKLAQETTEQVLYASNLTGNR